MLQGAERKKSKDVWIERRLALVHRWEATQRENGVVGPRVVIMLESRTGGITVLLFHEKENPGTEDTAQRPKLWPDGQTRRLQSALDGACAGGGSPGERSEGVSGRPHEA